MKPKTDSIRVLVADDDDQDRVYMAAKIAAWGYITETAVDGADALEKSAVFEPHVVVSDLRMPKLDGFELIRSFHERGFAPPVILLTQFGNIKTAISAVHGAGAFWFLEKPVPLEALQFCIERASEQKKLEEDNERLRAVIRSEGIGEMLGRSPQMQEIFATIRQVAPSKATVLITGESGTGKELVARAIHTSSPRKDYPFVALNCAALPETLIESELFGHEKGAFTGATERRLGRIELAHGGTLFLDEIGELPPNMQAKLLRVLEDSKVQKLGSKGEVEVDVRILAATNRSPQKAVAEGKLREDLYYRLNVFQLLLPPLRERKDDIPLLVSGLLETLKKKHDRPAKEVEPEVMDRFLQYSWPGNVRELRNVLERAVILSGDGPITTAVLPQGLGLAAPGPAEAPSQAGPGTLTLNLGTTLYDAEKALILATLNHTKNNRQRTATILGLSLKTIQIKLKEYRAGDAQDSPGSAADF